MSCSRSDLTAGGHKRLYQGDRNMGGNTDRSLGQRTAANDDLLRSGKDRRCAGFGKRSVERHRVRHQRLWVSACQKAPQIAGPLRAHQSVDGRGELGRCCDDCKRRAVLPCRPRGRGSYANHGTFQLLGQGVSAGVPEGCNDNRRGWWQVGISDGPGSLRQCLGIGNHFRRGDICPTLHIRQVMPDDAQHRRGRLLRTVRIDQQNRFHQMRYPA